MTAASGRHVRATHFLAFPISSAACQSRAQEIINILLKASPRPDGIHESLATSSTSLHLTIGIMPLAGPNYGHQGGTSLHNVDDASRLLQECRTGLQEILQEEHIDTIPVKLDRLASFQSDPAKCRVLYAEPQKGSLGVETLHQLAAYLRERFYQEGMLSDYKQALTLHCTLMKASARKEKPYQQSKGPFDSTQRRKPEEQACAALPSLGADAGSEHRDEDTTQTARLSDFASDGATKHQTTAMSSTEPQQSSSSSTKSKSHGTRRRGVPKNYPFDASLVLNADPPHALGETLVDSVHLYQMGRKDASGAYVSLGHIDLFDPHA